MNTFIYKSLAKTSLICLGLFLSGESLSAIKLDPAEPSIVQGIVPKRTIYELREVEKKTEITEDYFKKHPELLEKASQQLNKSLIITRDIDGNIEFDDLRQ